MTNKLDKKIKIKNCSECNKLFFFDEIAHPRKKYCGRDCYLKFLRTPTQNNKLLRFFKNLKFWVIFVFCVYNLTEYEMILTPIVTWKPLLIVDVDDEIGDGEFNCQNENIFYIEQDNTLE